MDAPLIETPDLIEHDYSMPGGGRIVAFNVGEEEFDEKYAESFHERVKRMVIKMSPVSEEHDGKGRTLSYILGFYFSFNPIGQLREAPFMLRYKDCDIDREPDLMVILNDNPGPLTRTMMKGAPDICVEIISKESAGRDYGEKLTEYERLGAREYWIIDPLRDRATFYRMSEDGHYDLVSPDERGDYTTPILPKLALSIPDLFRKPAPMPAKSSRRLRPYSPR